MDLSRNHQRMLSFLKKIERSPLEHCLLVKLYLSVVDDNGAELLIIDHCLFAFVC